MYSIEVLVYSFEMLIAFALSLYIMSDYSGVSHLRFPNIILKRRYSQLLESHVIILCLFKHRYQIGVQSCGTSLNIVLSTGSNQIRQCQNATIGSPWSHQKVTVPASELTKLNCPLPSTSFDQVSVRPANTGRFRF